MSRFIDAPTSLRCAASIVLKDGTLAQCGRYAKIDDRCTQHAKMAILAKAIKEVYGSKKASLTVEG